MVRVFPRWIAYAYTHESVSLFIPNKCRCKISKLDNKYVKNTFSPCHFLLFVLSLLKDCHDSLCKENKCNNATLFLLLFFQVVFPWYDAG